VSAVREDLAPGFERTNDEIQAVERRVSAAFDELVGAAALEPDRWAQRKNVVRLFRAAVFTERFDHFQDIQATQEQLRDGVESYMDAVNEADRRTRLYGWQLKHDLRERIAMAILVLATLALVAGLRASFEREVKRREAARVVAEVARKEREKENWIALTAGLTHTIGNDILAYDAYGAEALELLGRMQPPPPDGVARALKFIHESNKARMGFVKFLDEFARARKDALAERGTRPAGLTAIDLEKLLHDVRRRVGEIEVADLPRDSTDPQVQDQIRRFTGVPLEVRAVGGDGAARLTAGKRGVLDFFCYELLKNALRNCSGRRAIEVEIEKRDGRVAMRFVNDLAIKEPQPATDAEHRARVDAMLAQCFEPGRGGGTGLGLFLIRYFAREYYHGGISAAVHDWERRLVAFTLDLPDDLAAAAAATAGKGSA
jgi:hypothetical protein